MKKKLVTIMVAVSMMAMCLTACSKDEETSKKEKKTTVVDSKKEDKDEKKAADLRAAFDKMAAQYPHESEIAGERELMALVEQKAKEA